MGKTREGKEGREEEKDGGTGERKRRMGDTTGDVLCKVDGTRVNKKEREKKGKR